MLQEVPVSFTVKSQSPYNAPRTLADLGFCPLSDFASATLSLTPSAPATKMPSKSWLEHLLSPVPGELSSQISTWLAPSSPSVLSSNVTLSLQLALSGPSRKQMAHSSEDPLRMVYKDVGRVSGNQKGWGRILKLLTVRGCSPPKARQQGREVGLETGSRYKILEAKGLSGKDNVMGLGIIGQGCSQPRYLLPSLRSPVVVPTGQT